jgi:hypothetical protein
MTKYDFQGKDYGLYDAVIHTVRVAGNTDERNGKLELMQKQIDTLAKMVASLVVVLDSQNLIHWRTVEEHILDWRFEAKP